MASNLTHLWKIGQPVVAIIDGEKLKGKIKETYPDHVLVDIPGYTDRAWFEPGFNLEYLYPAYNF